MTDWVLITGGTGTIGSALVRMLLKAGRRVRIFSRDEDRQAKLKEALEREGFNFEQYRFFIGDVRDLPRLQRAMKDVETVYNFAALKHVLACEYSPGEAVKTNILGSMNLIDAAYFCGVKTVVAASTDKAATGTSTMGVTKLVAERLLIQANGHGCKFIVMRFGNVVGSRGSVLNRWEEQLRAGEILITDLDATRFVMSIQQAAGLAVWAAHNGVGGEVFVNDMPVVRLGTLASVIIRNYERKHDLEVGSTKIKIIGLRPGETMHEILATSEEISRAVDLRGMYAVLPNIRFADPGYQNAYGSKAKVAESLSSGDRKALDEDKTRSMLREWGLI